MRQDEGPVARAPRRREPESEVLAPCEETIDSWFDDDCGNWRKQRHTATRVYVRLRDEGGVSMVLSTIAAPFFSMVHRGAGRPLVRRVVRGAA